MPSNIRSLGQTAVTGVAWLMAQSLSVRALSLVTQLVLTWLLSPAQLGAVGLANTVAALAAIVAGLGIEEVLVQRQRRLGIWAASAFWLSLGLGVLATTVLLLSAGHIAAAYRTPGLSGLIAVQAAAMPIAALSLVPTVKARIDLRFGFIAAYNTFELAVSQIAVVALAWAGFGAYSFVLPVPAFALIKAVVFWRRSPVAFTGRLRMTRVRQLAATGIAIFGSRAISEAVAQGDYIVLGLMTTDAVVGIYYFAFRLAAQPVRLLAGNFSAVMFPVLLRMREESARQTASAIHAGRVLAYAVMPLCFMQAALADPGLHLVAGPRWSDAIPIVQVLSIGLALDAPAWMAGALMNARGEFSRALMYRAVFSPAFFAAVYVGARIDAGFGTAVGVAIYYAVVTPIYAIAVFGRAITLRRFLMDVYGLPLLLAGSAIGLAYGLSLAPVVFHRQLLRCVLIALVGSVAYLCMFRWFQPALFDELARRAGLRAVSGAAIWRRLRNGPRPAA